MIDLSVSRSAGAPKALRIFGIGGAGANVLDRMVLDGVSASHLVAINTDSPALQASVAGQKLQIGESVTRGLGAGGDPELGHAAAEESFYALRSALSELDAVFLLGGLGGGTASGTLPAMAGIARQEGALVIAFVTMPFSFEGKRRREQAQEALSRLKQKADAVICFENDLMGEQVSPRAGIAQAFAVADQMLSQSVRAVAALFYRKGLINLGFDDLKAALAGNRARTLFAYGEAEGSNRPYDALARALKSPLMDKGRLLRDCETILIQVTGGPEMTLTEVELLMEEFNRKVEQRSRLLFGVATDPRSEGRMSVTLFATLAEEIAAEPEVSEREAEAGWPDEPEAEVAEEVKAVEVVEAVGSVRVVEPAEIIEAVGVADVAERIAEPALVEPVLLDELPAGVPEAEAAPEAPAPPRRSDGLDAIFGPRVPSVPDIAAERSDSPTVAESADIPGEFASVPEPEPPENVTAFRVIIDEETEESDDLEPLVPLEASPAPAEPVSLPSFVIEEEEEQEEAVVAAPMSEEPPVFEETVDLQQEEELSEQASLEEEPLEEALEEALDEAPEETPPQEETQTTLFREDGGSIFSRPATRATRPMPGRTLGSASPFFEQTAVVSPSAPAPTGSREREEAHDPARDAAPEAAVPEEEAPEAPVSPEPSASIQEAESQDLAPQPLDEAEVPAVLEAAESIETPEPTVANQDTVSEEKTALVAEERAPTEERAQERAVPRERREEPSPSAPKVPPVRAPQQETLKFEPTKRGRFEKSEPTIEDGQDLDVPTFLRRNIKIRPQ